MTDADSISAILGRYLLKGWTMAENCPVCLSLFNKCEDLLFKRETCPGCPLMKKNGQSFCARCDGDPAAPAPSQKPPKESLPLSFVSRSPSVSSESGSDRPSTPPTPSSTLLGNATLGDLPRLPVIDPAIAQARREQSDRASSAIGVKLLQGWTLLADECTNPECYGIPLMRAPAPRPKVQSDENSESTEKKTGRRNGKTSKTLLADPRKVCVICNTMYLQEADMDTFNAFEAQNKVSAGPPAKVSVNAAETSRATLKRVDNGQLTEANEIGRIQPRVHLPEVIKGENPTTKTRENSTHQKSSTSNVETALKTSLDRLSAHLTILSQSPHLDISELSQTATAIERVCSALKASRECNK